MVALNPHFALQNTRLLQMDPTHPLKVPLTQHYYKLRSHIEHLLWITCSPQVVLKPIRSRR